MTLRAVGLCAGIPTQKGEIRAVNDVSIDVPAGSIVGIVGESGCGKSMTARAIMGLMRSPARMTGGEIWLNGRDIARLPERQRRALRGSEMSMIFQEPMTSLNPVMKVGRQVAEAVRLHANVSRQEADRRAVEMFEAVGISDAASRARCYPHQLSGGLRQRVMIAMAMVCRPKLLIADEPTTALDVTVEAQILRLMRNLCDAGTSILLISHNLGVIAQLCDYVYVMYAGRIVEQAGVIKLFDHPAHPYTRGLLNAVSSLRRGGERLDTINGVVPNLLRLPEGCSFSLRCDACEARCAQEMPELREIAPGHKARCHLAEREAWS
ncbi:MAG: ABC transporter ATP-binding protein [Clostridia bacterium]|nr:ABC transporter ATP-binding protein [Clostridia bacterium]